MSKYDDMTMQELEHELAVVSAALEKKKSARRAELMAELEELDGPKRLANLAQGGRVVRNSRPQFRLPDGEEVYKKGPFRKDLLAKGFKGYDDLEPYRITYDKAGNEISKK